MKPLRANSPWTDERIGRLIKLHAAGLSYAEIGAALGMSRSAAIGKAARLGLGVPPGEIARRQAQAMAVANGVRLERQRTAASPRSATRKIGVREMRALPELVCAPVPESHPCTLMDLGPRSCRWPLWGDDEEQKLYCGAVTDDERAYCEVHHLIAHHRYSREDAKVLVAQD